jgi:hypothetical protein
MRTAEFRCDQPDRQGPNSSFRRRAYACASGTDMPAPPAPHATSPVRHPTPHHRAAKPANGCAPGDAAATIIRPGHAQRPIKLAAQQDHTTLPAPAHQSQCRLLALPAMPGSRPVTLGHHLGQRPLDRRHASRAHPAGASPPPCHRERRRELLSESGKRRAIAGSLPVGRFPPRRETRSRTSR